MKFDIIVEAILSEQVWDYDTDKVFYVKNEDGFVDKLEKLAKADPAPMANGLMPAKKPMFQNGTIAGKMADSQLWASMLLEYYKVHESPLKPKEILRNAQVKTNGIARFNFYKDVKTYLGEYLDYKLPQRKNAKKDPEEEEQEEEQPRRYIMPALGWIGSSLLSSLAPVGRRK